MQKLTFQLDHLTLLRLKTLAKCFNETYPLHTIVIDGDRNILTTDLDLKKFNADCNGRVKSYHNNLAEV
jgi:hypothetical protein